jgi:hypothetical protein
LDWRRWNAAADPADLPESGEPEDLILARPHDEALATAIGELWEELLPLGAQVDRVTTGPRSGDVEIVLRADTWFGADLFRAEGVGYNYASERPAVVRRGSPRMGRISGLPDSAVEAARRGAEADEQSKERGACGTALSSPLAAQL